MHGTIKAVLDQIENKKIRFLTEQVIDRNYDMFVTQPAACGNHHAYTGGLLVHSARVALLGGEIASFYDKIYDINRDVIIAGGMLHDIGKVHCYKVRHKMDGTEDIESTQMSKYHHHIPIGYHIVMREAEDILEQRPEMSLDSDALNRLLHIIISHHGRREYSSNRTPRTDEAFVVYLADSCDAYLDADNDAKRRFHR